MKFQDLPLALCLFNKYMTATNNAAYNAEEIETLI